MIAIAEEGFWMIYKKVSNEYDEDILDGRMMIWCRVYVHASLTNESGWSILGRKFYLSYWNAA